MKKYLYKIMVVVFSVATFWSCDKNTAPSNGELLLIVQNEKQEYIEGVEIAVADKQSSKVLFTRWSGVRGKINITNLEEGEYLFYAINDSYLSDTLTLAVVPGTKQTEALVISPKYGQLELIVVDDSGQALQGVNVTIKTSDEVLVAQETSDNEGKITLNNLLGNDYFAFISDESYVLKQWAFKIIPGQLNEVTLIAEKILKYAVEMNKNGFLNPSEMPPYGSTYSITAVIKPTGSGIRTISAFGNADGFASFFRLEGDNHLYLGQWSGAFKKVKSNEAVSNDIWSHIALVVNNNEVTFYINGVNVGSTFTNGSAPMDNAITPDNFKFGALYQTAFNYSEAYSGSFDALSYWTKALTPEEIQAEVENGLTGTEAELWGFWNFDDNAGTTTVDLSGSEHTLSLGGEASIYQIEN